MNLGYVGSEPIELDSEDLKDQRAINLYCELLNKTDLRNKDLLEIGCGAGGGCYVASKYFFPKSVTGLDQSDRFIKRNTELYSNYNISFNRGDAEKLPYHNRHFDIVLNLESSHCYPSRARFLSEVIRVLKYDGLFLYADIMSRKEMEEMKQLIRNRFKITFERNISEKVVLAIESGKKVNKNRSGFSGIVKRMLGATQGTLPFQGLKTGEYIYWLAVCKKQNTF